MDARYTTIATQLGLPIPSDLTETQLLREWYKSGDFCRVYQQHDHLVCPPLLKQCLDAFYYMTASIPYHNDRISPAVIEVFGTKAWFKLYCESINHKNPVLTYDKEVFDTYPELFEEFILWLAAKWAPKGHTVALAFLGHLEHDILYDDIVTFGTELVAWGCDRRVGASAQYHFPMGVNIPHAGM